VTDVDAANARSVSGVRAVKTVLRFMRCWIVSPADGTVPEKISLLSRPFSLA
jgi:hypothetical protein